MTSILGLHWERNFFAETGDRSYTLVANEGPLVSDFHYYAYESGDYLLHVGHLNRFTFFGDPKQEITAEFVDCRKGSPSLHELVRLDFTPDPRKVLHVAQGIAMKFSGMRDILVRSEPVWFAPSSATTSYNVGNDQTFVPGETPASRFPEVSVNDLPLPRKCCRSSSSGNRRFSVTGTPTTQPSTWRWTARSAGSPRGGISNPTHRNEETMSDVLTPMHVALDELRGLVSTTTDAAERQGLEAFIECVTPHLVENAQATFLGKITPDARMHAPVTGATSAEALEALKEHFEIVVE